MDIWTVCLGAIVLGAVVASARFLVLWLLDLFASLIEPE